MSRKYEKEENKKFVAFLEQEYGYKLSGKEKKTAIGCRKVAARLNEEMQANAGEKVAAKSASRKSFFTSPVFRYLSVAFLIIVCLSIVLPITLSNSPSNEPGGNIYQAQEHQFDLVSEFYDVIDERGFLFFNNIDDGGGLGAVAFYETDANTGYTLSYFIRELGVANNALDNFFFPVEFRIVTNPNYIFSGFELFSIERLPLYYNVGSTTLIHFVIDTDYNSARVTFQYGEYRYFIHLIGDDDPSFLTVIDRYMIQDIMRELILG